MDDIFARFLSAMHQFHKLPFGELFHDMTKMEAMTLVKIECHNRQKGENTLTITELAEKMNVKAPAISRTLKALEDKRLVERTVNQADRRNTHVRLTEPGKKTLAECEHMMDDFAGAIVRKMNREDLERLIGYLNELYRISAEEIALRKSKTVRIQQHE